MAEQRNAVVPAGQQPAPVAQTGIDLGGGVIASLAQCSEIARQMAGAVTLPKHFQREPDIMAAMLMSASLGLPLMSIIQGSHNIQGKICPSADLMAAAVRGRCKLTHWDEGPLENPVGYFVEATREGAKLMRVEFTVEDAKAAGLTGSDNWKKYPSDMCRARALSRLCRRVAPDILAGVYDPEEVVHHPVSDGPVYADDGVIEAEVETCTATDPDTRKKLRGMLKTLGEQTDFDGTVAQVIAVLKCATEEYAGNRIASGGETEKAMQEALLDGISAAYELAADANQVKHISKVGGAALDNAILPAEAKGTIMAARQGALDRIAKAAEDDESEPEGEAKDGSLFDGEGDSE